MGEKVQATARPLVMGPQDGAWVEGVDLPEVIYVGPRSQWAGDLYVGWRREASEWFPNAYFLGNDGKYFHEYKLTP